jgi:hypothetical protein
MFVIPLMANQAVAMASPPPHLLLCILIPIASYSRENGRELTVLGLGGELSEHDVTVQLYLDEVEIEADGLECGARAGGNAVEHVGILGYYPLRLIRGCILCAEYFYT